MEQVSHILLEGGQGEIVEKKSRFIANIFPVKTEEEALEKITEMKKKYYDARHNCYAYIIGDNHEIERSGDDGEPSGTAGRPMLEVLTGQGICDVVAVVTRYFGGTLLGTGGLVRAYSGAVKEGLSHCTLMEQFTGYLLTVKTDYNDIGKLQYLARTRGLHELSSEYADDVTLQFLVPREDIEAVEKEIVEKTSGKSGLERGDCVRYGIAQGQVIFHPLIGSTFRNGE